MNILNVYMTVGELLGWQSPLETPQQWESQLRCAGHVTARGSGAARLLPCRHRAIKDHHKFLSSEVFSWPMFSHSSRHQSGAWF